MDTDLNSIEKTAGFDLIGDIHGCENTLAELLEKLGYSRKNGVYQHHARKVIFVGDVIDRGPRIREALSLVKGMVDQGFAYCILGNHEFNAVAYTTVLDGPKPESPFMRHHNVRNDRLIKDTLAQFAPYPEEWRMYLEWFKTLPLFLDLNGLRVVHACWHHNSVALLQERAGKRNAELRDIFPGLLNGERELSQAIDRLTRGTSLQYPDDRFVLSRDGIKRRIFRTKFWAKKPQTYQDVVFQPDPLPDDLKDRELSKKESSKLVYYSDDEKPVFVGHYWLKGKPHLQKSNVACLDYSAVKYGRLVAYRWDGEQKLHESKFQWVDVHPA